MKTLLRAGALALALFLCAPLLAQTLAGAPIKAPAGFLPGMVSYCDDGTGHAIACAPGGGSSPTDTPGSGTINAATSNAVYAVTLNASGTVAFAVSGLTGTTAVLTLEGTNNGTTWAAITAITVPSGATFSTIAADTQFRVNASGRRGIRLRVSTVGTGTITVASNISQATSEMTVDPYNAAFWGSGGAMTVGTAYPYGRSLKANCTATGNVSVTYADGSTDTWVISAAGTTVLPIAVTTVNTSGTTATCTYANLK